MKYTLSEQERNRRRAYTATLIKCKCGNIAGKDQTRCGKCREMKEKIRLEMEEDELQRKRNEWIDQMMGKEL